MKPIKLILEAFGSFPGTETIDFAALAPRGLFVVSGDTGTGKTTIFDAMCWALYGEMPLKDSRGVKCDHAPPTTKTRVTFTFECGGERYVVTRTPEQLRPAERGNRMVTDPAKAHLERITDGGTESLATKASAVSDTCKDLIGLDAAQFQRVILLPQGEFSRFLLASTNDREALLGQLFGGDVFDHIVEQLKQERDDLRTQLGNTDALIDAALNDVRTNLRRASEPLQVDLPDDLDVLERDAIEPLLDTIAAPLGALQDEVTKLAEAAKHASEAHHRAEQEAKRFREAEQHRAVLAKLDEQADNIRANRESATASAAARPVAVATDDLARALEAEAAAKRARDERLAEIGEAFRTIGIDVDTSSVGSIRDHLATAREKHRDSTLALKALRDAEAALNDATTANETITADTARATADRAAASQQLDELTKTLPDIRALAASPASLATELATVNERITARRDLDSLQAKLVDAARAATDAAAVYQQTFESFVATQAPRLAQSLMPGEPCPVCGSVDHPRPASGEDSSRTTDDDVQQAGKARDKANEAVSKLDARHAELRATLADDADIPIDELEARKAQITERHERASVAAQQLAELEQHNEALNEQIAAAERQLAALDERAKNAADTIATCTADLEAARGGAVGIDGDDLTRTGKVLDALDGHVVGLDDLFGQVQQHDGSVRAAKQRQSEALSQSQFDSVDAARSALLAPEDEQAKIDAAAEHERARHEATTALATLDNLGVPDQAPDLDATGQAMTEAEAAHKERTTALTSATDALEYSRDALAKHDALVGGSAEARERYDRAELAYAVCQKGGPGADMSLKRWVLTRELDRVTAAANVHLQRMTSGRYSLHRSETRADGRKKFGLDLEVSDATTGRPRATSSLSGGEQFQASLALALGLADVVSHGGAASGKTFETLFVDEGFGSLDPRSLDDAIDTLHQLHATGRMVGAITHVEAMKQQLHLGIEVKRLPHGGGSTLVVHP